MAADKHTSTVIRLVLVACVINVAMQSPALLQTIDYLGMAATETAEYKNEHGVPLEYLLNGRGLFLETAQSFTPITDKVTAHMYQIMYGEFLLPYYYKHPTMKMLEIGLGCDMSYGPGASTEIWKKLFPLAEKWEAEYDARCVEANRDTSLTGLNVLVGDQSDPDTLRKWITDSGGGFDVVIDDGGHTNCQIWTSFQALWPEVKKGGLYFIEDMQVARNKNYRLGTKTCNGENLIVPDKLKDMVDRLVYMYDKQRSLNFLKPNPFDVESVFCQYEACVLRKSLA